MLLVDALRADYLRHTPFLKSLAAGSTSGVLREGFGFVPRAAYFGGLSVGQYGFANMYCFDPERSPFTLTRALPLNSADCNAAGLASPRGLIEAAARDRLSPFARAYASSVEIPIHFLPWFDLVEKRAPWDKHVGYVSLFALLDERGIPWYQCSWPDTNLLPDHSDQAIVKRVLADLQPQHRFAYVHLQELDGTGHVHGPQSPQLQRCLATTDQLCQQLIGNLRERFGSVNIVLFGDHGMVNVTRTLDVTEALSRSGLAFGVDFVYFLDSTMARFWFFHRRARLVVEGILAELSGGRILGDDELRHYGIADCDSRNAELILLADPGVLIFPNFYQSQGEPIKGMHGYDPDCPDNLGFLLLHTPAQPELAGRTVGKVDPQALFPILLELLGLEPELHTVVKAPAPVRDARPTRRFTCCEEPEADALVEAQLQQVLRAVEQRVGRVQAVVLTGSFGRAEGGVYRNGDNRLHPVNDYDLLVIDPRDLSASLNGLGGALANELGIDFVDLGYSDGRWESLPLTIFNYDLKYGSQVLAGDQAVLDHIPAYAAADMPAYEPVKLLLNRTAGLLSGLRGAFLDGQKPTTEEQRYLTNQVVKALVAIGDAHLVRWQGYDSSYRTRRLRFEWLARGASLEPKLAEKVCQAYEFKCQPDYSRFADGLREIRDLYPQLEMSLIHSINRLAGRQEEGLAGALTSYLAHQSADAKWVETDNVRCTAHPDMQVLLLPGCRPQGSLRHLVYSVLPPLLAAAVVPECGAEACGLVREVLATCFRLPTSTEFSGEHWEQLRASIVKAWFAVCH